MSDLLVLHYLARTFALYMHTRERWENACFLYMYICIVTFLFETFSEPIFVENIWTVLRRVSTSVSVHSSDREKR